MNIDMIRAAEQRIEAHRRVTPLLASPALDALAGRRILVKAECLQHSGSFKFRGAMAALTALNESQRQRGVIAYSSGNHAQGIALAAARLGIRATIVMPHDAPAIKRRGTLALGAEVIEYQRGRESREAIGEQLADQRGMTLIRPYDEPQVIAGQGTVGLEIAAQCATLNLHQAGVLVCCGGGGLTAGIALALEADAPAFDVFPVEPEHFDDTARSLVLGQRVRNASESGSLCDAIITPTPGELTFPILKRRCSRGWVVTEAETLIAMRHAFETLKIVLEPGGAVALAAALFRKAALNHDTLVVVASGGNVDREVFRRALNSDSDEAPSATVG